MHVEVDQGSGLDELSGIALILFVAPARHERQQLLDFLRSRSAVGPSNLIAGHHLSVGSNDAAILKLRTFWNLVDDVQAGVMHDTRSSRTYFQRLHIDIAVDRHPHEE